MENDSPTKYFAWHWQPDDHNFSTLESFNCTFSSKSWSQKLSHILNWHGWIFYVFITYSVLLYFWPGIIRVLQISVLPDGVRVNPIQLTSSKSASPRFMSILVPHLCVCLNLFYSLYVLQLVFDVSKPVLFSVATQWEYVGPLKLLDVIVLKCKICKAPQYAGLLVFHFRRVCIIAKSDY
jgi:hypothetical protein